MTETYRTARWDREQPTFGGSNLYYSGRAAYRYYSGRAAYIIVGGQPIDIIVGGQVGRNKRQSWD